MATKILLHHDKRSFRMTPPVHTSKSLRTSSNSELLVGILFWHLPCSVFRSPSPAWPTRSMACEFRTSASLYIEKNMACDSSF